jgi:hypothetical protein
MIDKVRRHKYWRYINTTASFTDLDQGLQDDYFKVIFDPFYCERLFRGHCGSSKNWLELKMESP